MCKLDNCQTKVVIVHIRGVMQSCYLHWQISVCVFAYRFNKKQQKNSFSVLVRITYSCKVTSNCEAGILLSKNSYCGGHTIPPPSFSQVGSFLKSPKFPIWILGSETHLSVFFTKVSFWKTSTCTLMFLNLFLNVL